MPPSVACRVGAGSCWLVQGVMEAVSSGVAGAAPVPPHACQWLGKRQVKRSICHPGETAAAVVGAAAQQTTHTWSRRREMGTHLLHAVGQAQAAAAAMAGAVDLAKKVSAPAAALSGGMKRKLQVWLLGPDIATQASQWSC